MKTRNERDELLDEVLSQNNELRANTLDRGLKQLRRRQVSRRRTQIFSGIMAVLFLAVLISRNWPDGRVTVASGPAQPGGRVSLGTIKGTPIQMISDEELLEVFKDRPVALVGRSGRRELLILDEAN